MNTTPPLPKPDLQTDPCSVDGTQTDYYAAETVRRLLAAQPVAIQGYKCVASAGAVLFTESEDAAAEMQRQGWTVIELSEAKPVAVPDGWIGVLEHVIAELESLDEATAQAQCVTLRELLTGAPKGGA